MAKKKQNKPASSAQTAQTQENVENLWSDFSEQMEKKLKGLFESGTAEYQEINAVFDEAVYAFN